MGVALVALLGMTVNHYSGSSANITPGSVDLLSKHHGNGGKEATKHVMTKAEQNEGLFDESRELS